MIRILMLAGLLSSIAVGPLTAQQRRSPQEVLDQFIEKGVVARWLPYEFFRGCPALDEWQEEGIDLFMRADLTPAVTRTLAIMWSMALDGCRDERLEHWYFEKTDAAIARGDGDGWMLSFWDALGKADSPNIRAYLRSMMLDVALPESPRTSAGFLLFNRMTPEERRAEYLRGVESGMLPMEIIWGQTGVVIREDAHVFLREISDRVRIDPALAEQPAFGQVIVDARQWAPASARSQLAETLRQLASRPSLGDERRARLARTAEFLMTER